MTLTVFMSVFFKYLTVSLIYYIIFRALLCFIIYHKIMRLLGHFSRFFMHQRPGPHDYVVSCTSHVL